MAFDPLSVPEAGPGPAPPPSWDTLLSVADRPLASERIRLENGGAILLEADGFRLNESRGFKRSSQQAYDSITHLAVTDRALLVATDSGLSIIRSKDFVDSEDGPQEAERALLARLDRHIKGPETRRHIDRLEAFSRSTARPYAIWAVAALCFVAALAQLQDVMVKTFGAFVPEMFYRGEYWRAVTGQFLHGAPTFPIHLVMNVAGLWVLGNMVERPLGSLRTLVVLGFGGVGTIIGSLYAGYEEVIGASGLVFGIAGAMLALELHYPKALPAYWRMPRGLFIGALVLQFGVIDQLVPVLAGEAHLGGFIGGYLAAWAVGAERLDHTEPGNLTRFVAIGTIVATATAFAMAFPLLSHEEGALERHALRLLNTPTVVSPDSIQHDNAIAWFIVTEGEPSPTGLDLAVALAGRAVNATARQNPSILDTLAEALFQADDRLGALLTIDEAIRLAPGVTYFEEQRRRFTGERAADDRPIEPGEGDLADELPADELFESEDAPALTL